MATRSYEDTLKEMVDQMNWTFKLHGEQFDDEITDVWDLVSIAEDAVIDPDPEGVDVQYIDQGIARHAIEMFQAGWRWELVGKAPWQQ